MKNSLSRKLFHLELLDNVLTLYFYLSLIKLGFLKVFFLKGAKWPPFIFQDELIWFQCNFAQSWKMLTSSVICWRNEFLCNKKMSIIQKIDENSWYSIRKSSYLLSDFRIFNDIFRKDVTYDNFHKKNRPSTSL